MCGKEGCTEGLLNLVGGGVTGLGHIVQRVLAHPVHILFVGKFGFVFQAAQLATKLLFGFVCIQATLEESLSAHLQS